MRYYRQIQRVIDNRINCFAGNYGKYEDIVQWSGSCIRFDHLFEDGRKSIIDS